MTTYGNLSHNDEFIFVDPEDTRWARSQKGECGVFVKERVGDGSHAHLKLDEGGGVSFTPEDNVRVMKLWSGHGLYIM